MKVFGENAITFYWRLRDYKRRKYEGHSQKAMFSSLKQEVNSNILTVLQQSMDYMDQS